MIWPALLGAAGTAAGGLFSFLGAKGQNKAAARAADKQMAFQERMSNTAYQRSMADMKAAGLNPMLAYQQGGATTPSGAMPNIVNELEGLGNSAKNLSSNIQAARLSQEAVQKAKIENKILAQKLIQEQTNSARSLQERKIYDTIDPLTSDISSAASQLYSSGKELVKDLASGGSFHSPASTTVTGNLFRDLPTTGKGGATLLQSFKEAQRQAHLQSIRSRKQDRRPLPKKPVSKQAREKAKRKLIKKLRKHYHYQSLPPIQ